MTDLLTELPTDAIDDLHQWVYESGQKGQTIAAWLEVGDWLDKVKPVKFWRNTGGHRQLETLALTPGDTKSCDQPCCVAGDIDYE